MPRASVLFVLCLLPGFLACNSSSSSSTETDAITLIAVDPADFPAGVDCALHEDGSVPGGAYVAELIDVSGKVSTDSTNTLEEFPVQSSTPAKCGTPIGFPEAIADRVYEVDVTVYPDLDGDPNTVDICTVEGTSVTLVRPKNGCPKTLDGRQTLATPVTTFRCYGWAIQPSPKPLAAETPSEKMSPREGAPVLAIDQRTVFAHYCREKNSN
jgi:hypothetical protein